MQDAEEAFLQAIALNNEYARAYVGLGGVYLKRSAKLLDVAISSGQAADPKAAQWVEQAIESYQKVLELKPDPEQYGNPVEDVARLALGNAYRLKGAIAVTQGDATSALDALDQAIQTLEEVRPVFETSTQEHESYRRYLAQTYEYLGDAYQGQGLVFEQVSDLPQLLASYEQSLYFYNQCIAQSKNSPDLIIQKEIVGLRCQPKYQETKVRYDNFKGEQ